MVGLIVIAFFVALGIYYVTTLDFEIGSGFSEDKSKAKDVEYTESDVTRKTERKLSE